MTADSANFYKSITVESLSYNINNKKKRKYNKKKLTSNWRNI